MPSRFADMPRILIPVFIVMLAHAVLAFANMALVTGTLVGVGLIGLVLRREFGRALLWVVTLGYVTASTFALAAMVSDRDFTPLDVTRLLVQLVSVGLGGLMIFVLLRDDVSAWLVRRTAEVRRLQLPRSGNPSA